jgi:signal transduction histidine kinase
MTTDGDGTARTNEQRRLSVFAQYRFLIDQPNEMLEEICRLACGLFHVSHAHIALLGEDDGYYLTQTDIGRTSFKRDTSITQRFFERPDITVISDAGNDAAMEGITSFHRAGFVAAAPLWMEAGVSLGVLSIFDASPRDFDEKDRVHLKRLSVLAVNELGRQRGARQLQDREASLIRARDAADAANVAKSTFLATMSHEIRTPLNGVLGMAQVMAADVLTPQQQERLETITRSGETLLALLNDILDLAKIEAGKYDLESIAFDIAELVHRARDTFLAVAEGKGLSLTVDLEASATDSYRGDPTRLRQILHNLISNAIKFTDRGGVSVTVRHAGGVLICAVRDTGCGIPEEKQARLFNNFVQADASTTRRHGGTGLGLSISRKLAELMEGSLTVESVDGVGSVFTLAVPLERLAGAVPGRAETAQPVAGKGLRVLAAEDNVTNQKVLAALLGQIGIHPVIVDDGGKAVDLWEAQEWDLVLMDIRMPNMDGRAATVRIRERETVLQRRRTPIIALTADSMSHQTSSYTSWGMDGFLSKPIVNSSLRDLIERYRSA